MSNKQSPELKKPKLTLLENNKANRLNVSRQCVHFESDDSRGRDCDRPVNDQVTLVQLWCGSGSLGIRANCTVSLRHLQMSCCGGFKRCNFELRTTPEEVFC